MRGQGIDTFGMVLIGNLVVEGEVRRVIFRNLVPKTCNQVGTRFRVGYKMGSKSGTRFRIVLTKLEPSRNLIGTRFQKNGTWSYPPVRDGNYPELLS